MQCTATLFVSLAAVSASSSLRSASGSVKSDVAKRASACPRARGRARRVAWLRFRAQQYEQLPTDKVWLLDRLRRKTMGNHSQLSTYLKSYLSCHVAEKGRFREVFPMPVFRDSDFRPDDWPLYRWKVALEFLNVVLGGLHFLANVDLSTGVPKSLNASQRTVCANLVARGCDFVARLNKVDEIAVGAGLPSWVHGNTQDEGFVRRRFVSEEIDVPDVAGTVDFAPFLDKEVLALIEDPTALFANAPPGLDRFAGVQEDDKHEYVRHTAKLIKCGKIILRSSVCAGGPVFTVARSNGRAREVWHGSMVSRACRPPPKPPHLASVSALTHIRLNRKQRLRVSKRDAKCAFDQMKLPPRLGKWLARPRVTLEELMKIGGLSLEEVQEVVDFSVNESIYLYLVPTTWPMGFAYSSFVSQSGMVGLCQQGGLSMDNILSADSSVPLQTSELFAVATDDLMLFSSDGPGRTLEMADRVGEALANNGVVIHEEKNVDDALNAQCIGIALEEGVQWAPPPSRCLGMLLLVLVASASVFRHIAVVRSSL